MAHRALPVFDGAYVTPVADQQYSATATGLVRDAKRRCLASLFIVDLTPRYDKFLVDDLLIQLARARRQRLDVRVIVSGSNDSLAILEASAIAFRRMRHLGVPARWAAKARRPTHAKLMICDDAVLLGSHNWSAVDFRGSTQDSVLVRSPRLADSLGKAFERNWSRNAA